MRDGVEPPYYNPPFLLRQSSPKDGDLVFDSVHDLLRIDKSTSRNEKLLQLLTVLRRRHDQAVMPQAHLGEHLRNALVVRRFGAGDLVRAEEDGLVSRFRRSGGAITCISANDGV